MAEYTLCHCGHSDDRHQTLLPNRVLTMYQRVCYGAPGRDDLCKCEGYGATAVVVNKVALRQVENAPDLSTGLDRAKRSGHKYRWL